MKINTDLKMVRRLLVLFMVSLFVSGLTAMPVITEMQWALAIVPADTALHAWLSQVYTALLHADTNAPFLFYGYDWLAFAHYVLAILFIGPYKDPVKNIWVTQFGLIACVLVLPFAAVAGHFRGLPLWWRLVDCSFGVFGFALLWVIYVKTMRLAKASAKMNAQPSKDSISTHSSLAHF